MLPSREHHDVTCLTRMQSDDGSHKLDPVPRLLYAMVDTLCLHSLLISALPQSVTRPASTQNSISAPKTNGYLRRVSSFPFSVCVSRHQPCLHNGQEQRKCVLPSLSQPGCPTSVVCAPCCSQVPRLLRTPAPVRGPCQEGFRQLTTSALVLPHQARRHTQLIQPPVLRVGLPGVCDKTA